MQISGKLSPTQLLGLPMRNTSTTDRSTSLLLLLSLLPPPDLGPLPNPHSSTLRPPLLRSTHPNHLDSFPRILPGAHDASSMTLLPGP